MITLATTGVHGQEENGHSAIGKGRPSSGRTFIELAKLEKCTPRLAERLDTEMLPPTAVWFITRAELRAFSDASQRAIGVAVYLHLFNCKERYSVSLVFGQAKVVPINPISIPRLELCGGVLAVKAVDRITEEIDLDMEISETLFCIDQRLCWAKSVMKADDFTSM